MSDKITNRILIIDIDKIQYVEVKSIEKVFNREVEFNYSIIFFFEGERRVVIKEDDLSKLLILGINGKQYQQCIIQKLEELKKINNK